MNSVRRMLMRQVDGVVLMASEADTQVVEPLLDRKIPIVTIDRRRAPDGTGDVAIDFEDGYRQAVQHLHQLGHRRIGFIGGMEGIRTSEVRLKAFQKALQTMGMPYEPRFVRPGNYRVSGGDAAMRSLLNEIDRPTAVITANDLTAFGALRALHACGVNVPSEMSVVGFDGIMLSDAVYPPLTTVVVPQKEIAKACAGALDHIKSKIGGRGFRLNVRGSLLVRQSTAPPPAQNRNQRQR
jgi:DNA-binding LacI/PurR family transcriptional regulator